MIYKTVSCKEVIARVYAGLDKQAEDRWVDMVEWIGQALDKIGTYTQLEHKVACVDIVDYKGVLPCDFYSVNQIYYNGYPMRPNPSTMGNYLVSIKTGDNNVDPFTEAKLEDLPGFLKANTSINVYNQHTFTMDSCYIRPTFKEGTLFMSYNAFPVDEDGFPLVPKDEMFIEACFWYILMMLALPDWYAGRGSRYEDCRAKWNFYCVGAAAKANSPDLMRLENIKDQWVRLLPNINRFSTFFANLNKQENLNL